MLHRFPVRRLVGVALLGFSLAPGLASAHYPWMTPADYGPPAGEALEFSIHSGHAFTDGIAAVPLDHAGRWLLRASASEPYTAPLVCDQSHDHATLTLMVR